jgi:hypothetical protein
MPTPTAPSTSLRQRPSPPPRPSFPPLLILPPIMHRNHILDIMSIPMLLPEIIIERVFVPLPSVPVPSHFPRLIAGPLWVRILERVEEELYGKAADPADPGAECEA